MLKLKLYGDMANKYGAEHKLEVKSFVEAIKLMSINYEGFEQDTRAEFYCLRNEEPLTPETLAMQFKDGDLHMLPKPTGDGEWLVTAVAIAIFEVTGVTALTAIAIAEVIVSIVVSLAISCVASLLAGTPDKPSYDSAESPAHNPSFLFQGANNRFEQGGGISILYGEMKVGSNTISSMISMDDKV